MPTERFFRLPHEKQGAIMEAAIQEFSRVPLESVSINKIIRGADISRGSFYTYFEDKQDLFCYLVEQLVAGLKEDAGECFERCEKNIFEASVEFLKKIFHRCKNQDSDQLFRNMLTSANELGLLSENTYPAECCTNSHEMQELYRICAIPKECEVDFWSLLELIHAMLCQAMGMRLMMRRTEEEILKDFKRKLELVRRGFENLCAEVGK